MGYLLESGKATSQGGKGPATSVTWPTDTVKSTDTVKPKPVQKEKDIREQVITDPVVNPQKP